MPPGAGFRGQAGKKRAAVRGRGRSPVKGWSKLLIGGFAWRPGGRLSGRICPISSLGMHRRQERMRNKMLVFYLHGMP